MPIYEYQCQDCRRVLEVREPMNAPAEHVCPNCGGGKMKKILSLFATPAKSSSDDFGGGDDFGGDDAGSDGYSGGDDYSGAGGSCMPGGCPCFPED